MKRILRHYVIDTVTLYLVSKMTEGLVFQKGLESILLAGVGLALTTMLLRPIINILLLPINLITFGLFKWISSAITLYLVTLVVPGFNILGFNFLGFSTSYFSLPAFSLGGIFVYVGFSFLISIISSLIFWLVK